MKLVITFMIWALAIGAFALTDEQDQIMDVFAEECIKETQADPEAAANMRKGDFSKSDRDLQCFAACLFKKSGIFNSEGNFDESVATEILLLSEDKTKVAEVVEKCKTLKGHCPCETAFMMYECYHNNKNVV